MYVDHETEGRKQPRYYEDKIVRDRRDRRDTRGNIFFLNLTETLPSLLTVYYMPIKTLPLHPSLTLSLNHSHGFNC